MGPSMVLPMTRMATIIETVPAIFIAQNRAGRIRDAPASAHTNGDGVKNTIASPYF